MYSREKSLKRDQSRRNPPLSSTQFPSFSSTLLDEIYSSIDNVKSDRFKLPNNNKFPIKQSTVETPNLRPRPSLVENKLVHDDPIPFISSSSSSDSSSGGDMGSPAVYKQRTSCFTGAPSLMKIKTTVSNQPEKSPKSEPKPKEKMSALKMYNNLKMMKQLPVSPGIRFNKLFNTLFRHGNSKKSTNQSEDSKSTTCSSSAGSYYRSCLTKKTTTTSVNPEHSKRTVRFNPVSVIVDCGTDSDKFGRRRITCGMNSNRKLVDMRNYSCEEDEGDDIDDDDSDTSSDLFEIDHLVFMGSYDRDYREELPVMKLPTSRYVSKK